MFPILEQVPIPKPTPQLTTAVILSVAIFLIICVGIGFYMLRKAKSWDEYAIGLRDIGPAVTGLALTATWMSGWAIFGNAGLSYTYGWSGGWLIGIMNGMGLAMCCVLGYRMRRYAGIGARTVPEVLKVRFDSRLPQALAGLIMIVLLIAYSVGQYKAMAAVLTVAGVTGGGFSGFGAYGDALFVTAVLTWIYLAVGGYAGTQLALAFQGAVFLVVGWIFGIWSMFWAGGPDKIATAIAAEKFVRPGGAATPVSIGGYTAPLAPTYPGYDWIGVTAVLFMFMFMATGFPHNIARFLGHRKFSKRDFWVMIIFVILNCITPMMIGAMGYAARAMWGGQLMGDWNKPLYGDAAAAYVSVAMGGPAGAGLFAAAVYAAAVSTLAGMVFIMATNVSRDLIFNLAPKTSGMAQLWITRIFLIPWILLPLYWALTAPPPVLSEFMAGSAVAQGGIFFFVVAVSMYWKRATKWGVVAAMVYGFILTLLHPAVWMPLWKTAPVPPFNHWGQWALLLMFGCAAVYFVVSLATKPMPKEKLDKLFPAK